eukprot:CAMPEP_0117893788 /NCGR_PEP_ID=MMETSP0950-20121206/25539_1 /TAXON_ID=44440 /ORGANISM="Chattonella subsalsa, Strain CCMP2191" /LENGTH=31 /DNA_ID= /DNA_START= /DNA_END= /DNA_ORIENTATION=
MTGLSPLYTFNIKGADSGERRMGNDSRGVAG